MAAIRVSLFSFLLFLAACSGEKEETVQLFYGPCNMSVDAGDSKAEILVDGIKVGKGSIELSVPCGYRQVVVKKKNYVPIQEYHLVEKGAPLAVTTKLEKLGDLKDYALSEDLVERVRQGMSPEQPKEAAKEAQDGAPQEEAAADDWS